MSEKETTLMNIKVSVSDTEIFKDMLDLMKWMYDQLPEDQQAIAMGEIDKMLGGTHDLTEFRKGSA